MAEKYFMEGTLALEENQRQIIVIEAAGQPRDIKLRVAAYARVSSDSDDQINSFDAQNRYYSALISGKENWQMVDIYADRGISGTSAAKRDDFQRLLSDCRSGKIDRILVKSISRFARNAKECLEVIRELKLLGISVYFEKENIDTGKLSGEMMTAMFASMAQAEKLYNQGTMTFYAHENVENLGVYIFSCSFTRALICGKIIINDVVSVQPQKEIEMKTTDINKVRYTNRWRIVYGICNN